MKVNYSALLFIIILLCVSFFYNYQEIVLKRPQSIHKWRQSDCASIALNYYQGGMHFLKPETHNLTSDGGTSGKCCTSEVPVLYYTVAAFYKVFGYHDSIYRIFNTLLFFLGLFFLFRLLHYLLKDIFWEISLSLLFFTSPVLVFYGNNYLSNSSALAFSIVGWYYFLRFSFESKHKWFYVSMIFFMLAAAFKVTALFSLFAIAGLYVLEWLGVKKFNEGTKLFHQHLRFLIPVFSVFSVIGFWLVYASYFNQKHDCTYFSTTIFPIWDLSREEIKGVLDSIRNMWLDQYFHKSALLFLAVCFLFILTYFRKNNKLLLFSLLFIFVEVIAYILLQFWTFADHDYYTIDIYILPILIVVSAFDLLNRHFPKIFNSSFSKIGFSVFLLFNIYYAHQKVNERYEGWMNDYPENKDIYSITPYLRQIGISPNDTIISIPDGSHASLYLMNQKGWTEYTDERFNKGTGIHYNQDSSGIQASIDKGAKYLIVNGIKELYTKTYLQSYCTNLIGNYNNVLIFDLKDRGKETFLEDRTIDKKINCNAELLNSNKQWFISETDSTSFEYGITQTDKFAHGGKYASKIDAGSPYGMTVKLKNLQNGESFKISVWRKTEGKSKGGLIASSSPNPYYNSEYKILETDSTGWEKICMDFFIPAELTGKEVVVYVYNPDPEPVYFDDLEIVRYKSVLNKTRE